MSQPTSLLPPARRTALWQAVTEAAARGRLVLPRCNACQAFQYPPRELCCHCLGSDLQWCDVDPLGTVLAFTLLHTSLEGFFRQHLPWPVVFVKLDSGPRLYAHAAKAVMKTGQGVRVLSLLDRSEQAIFLALPAEDESKAHLTEFAHLLHPARP